MRHTLVWIFSLPLLCGQTQVDLKTQSKSIDFTGASATKPMKSGNALPATCGAGEFFFYTVAPAGANVYACVSTNTWTLQGGGQGATGAGAPSAACASGPLYAVGQSYFDTTNGNTWLCESTGTWEKVLATANTGAFLLTGQNSTTPATPATGNTEFFFSSTANVGQTIDDAGGLSTMVRPTDCSATGKLAQSITSSGTVMCAGTVFEYTFPAGSGSNASPQTGAWWQDGSTSTVCPTGAPYQCSLHWNSGAALLAVTAKIPHAWTAGAVTVLLTYQGNGTGNTVQPAVSSGCIGNGAAAVTFNPAQSFPDQITSGSTYYIGTLSPLTMTGCSADSLIVLQFSRLDTGGFMNVASASIVFNVP